MIREDRELLAELALLNSDVVPLAMQVIDGSATAQEQRVFAHRLIAVGERLRRRADQCECVVVDESAAFAEAQDSPPDTGNNVVRHLHS